MSRPASARALELRCYYQGFDYCVPYNLSGKVKRDANRTGREWRELVAQLRLEHNGDCLAAYRGAELRHEIYLDPRP